MSANDETRVATTDNDKGATQRGSLDFGAAVEAAPGALNAGAVDLQQSFQRSAVDILPVRYSRQLGLLPRED